MEAAMAEVMVGAMVVGTVEAMVGVKVAEMVVETRWR